MAHREPNRRDFNQLAAAAFGGLLAGTGAALGDDKDKDKDRTTKPKDEKKNPLLQEPHVCRGLNTCKGNGKGGKNDCAGTSTCATAKAHTCHAENECRGLGGCGEAPGENACKGKGACGVPLGDKVWVKARKRFEDLMAKEGKKVGKAPDKAGK
jgi:hypothetical protein